MKTFYIDGYYIPASAIAMIKPPNSRIQYLAWTIYTINGEQFQINGDHSVLADIKEHFGIGEEHV